MSMIFLQTCVEQILIHLVLKPRELVTNGEFESNINSWTTGDGSPSHTSSGNGRLNLNDAAAYQAINTTVNKTYRLQLEF